MEAIPITGPLVLAIAFTCIACVANVAVTSTGDVVPWASPSLFWGHSAVCALSPPQLMTDFCVLDSECCV